MFLEKGPDVFGKRSGCFWKKVGMFLEKCNEVKMKA